MMKDWQHRGEMTKQPPQANIKRTNEQLTFMSFIEPFVCTKHLFKCVRKAQYYASFIAEFIYNSQSNVNLAIGNNNSGI